MFRIAHLTDPHVGPLPRPRLRELLNKRLTGFFNWHSGRTKAHDMELLAALVTDMHDQEPHHIACTGDVANIGLPEEWSTARVFLEGLGPPDRVSFVPGNHDAYIEGALQGLLAVCGPWTEDDGGALGKFPYVRRRGHVALVGLSSAIPTAPFVASGRMGRRQMEAAERILAQLGEEGLVRVVMIHHPPHVAGASAGRNLTDAKRFEAMIARTGAELVLHGHNHIGSVATIPGPHGPVPVVGAPSASSRGGTITHRAAYYLFDIDEEAGETPRIRAQLRGLKPDGTIGFLEEVSLTEKSGGIKVTFRPERRAR
ncbi:metallophosphoesterase family protein [Salinarimonas sp. NSM]|uniref:metallophosphoesterase family protein n=1 Tax=Salinarimonas sp. NSM TaxID=3458003 RepID=UPI004035ECF5